MITMSLRHDLPIRDMIELLGFIPSFLDENDPRPAKEQFDDRYVGGWRPLPGFKFGKGWRVSYPGDPPMKPLCVMLFRDEKIYLYPYSWVRIGDEMSRMD